MIAVPRFGVLLLILLLLAFAWLARTQDLMVKDLRAELDAYRHAAQEITGQGRELDGRINALSSQANSNMRDVDALRSRVEELEREKGEVQYVVD